MNEPVYLEKIQFSAMFCDDVRLEQDGQVNYIGVYQPHLTVKEFPYRFRTFAAALTLLGPIEIAEEPIVFRVMRNKKIIMEYSPSVDQIPKEGRDLRMSVNMTAESFEISERSKFTAEISIGTKNYLSRNVLLVDTKPFLGETLREEETGKFLAS